MSRSYIKEILAPCILTVPTRVIGDAGRGDRAKVACRVFQLGVEGYGRCSRTRVCGIEAIKIDRIECQCSVQSSGRFLTEMAVDLCASWNCELNRMSRPIYTVGVVDDLSKVTSKVL